MPPASNAQHAPYHAAPARAAHAVALSVTPPTVATRYANALRYAIPARVGPRMHLREMPPAIQSALDPDVFGFRVLTAGDVPSGAPTVSRPLYAADDPIRPPAANTPEVRALRAERRERIKAQRAGDVDTTTGKRQRLPRRSACNTTPGENPLVRLPEGVVPQYPERPTLDGVPVPRTRGDCLTAVQRWAADARFALRMGEDVGKPPRYLPVMREDGSVVQRPADAGPDGVNAVRPCPYVGCKHHLAHHYDSTTGRYHLAGSQDEDDLIDRLVRGAAILDAGRAMAYLRGTLTQAEMDDPTYAPGAMVFSCALDVVAASDGATLELTGTAVDRTRERVRQVEYTALQALRERILSAPEFAHLRAYVDLFAEEPAHHALHPSYTLDATDLR
jgi:hypothetical protein